MSFIENCAYDLCMTKDDKWLRTFALAAVQENDIAKKTGKPLRFSKKN